MTVAHSTDETAPQPAKLTVKDFLLLADAGAFADYARTELIEGEIWVVNAVHTRHAAAHFKLSAVLAAALEASGSELAAYTAPSTQLSEESVPEPDLVLAEPHDERVLPLAKVRLAIEISDATLKLDLGRKAALYARHGLPEYWVVDIEARLVHQMWAPGKLGFSQRREVAFGDVLEAATIDRLTVETARI